MGSIRGFSLNYFVLLLLVVFVLVLFGCQVALNVPNPNQQQTPTSLSPQVQPVIIPAQAAVEEEREPNEVCNNNGKADLESEECDDGNFIINDGCNFCKKTFCGDGIVSDYERNSVGKLESCDPNPGLERSKRQEEGNKECLKRAGAGAVCILDECLCAKVVRPADTFCGDGEVQAPNSNNENEACDPGPVEDYNNDSSARNREGNKQCLNVTGVVSVCDPGNCTCTAFVDVPFCGDGITDFGEACDEGVFGFNQFWADWDCSISLGRSATCSNCGCVPDLTCAENTLAPFFGIAGNTVTGPACQDDCKDLQFLVPDAQIYCDKNVCECKIKEPKNKTKITCASNTGEVFFGGRGRFKAGMACADDCPPEIFGEPVYCDTSTCTCVPGKDGENKTFSCADNSQERTERAASLVPSGAVCKDDCERLGSGYSCDPEGCFCRYERVVTPRCGDGYISYPDVPGGGNEECDTGGHPIYSPKDEKGNPKKFPDTCEPPKVCVECRCVAPVTTGDEVTTGGDGNQSGCFEGEYKTKSICDSFCKEEGPNYSCLRQESGCFRCEKQCPADHYYKDSGCGGDCKSGDACVLGDVKECYYCKRGAGTTTDGTVTDGGGTQTGGGTTTTSCEDYCASKGKSVTQPDFVSSTLSYLNENGVCKKSATVSYSGATVYNNGCICYDTSIQPQISIGSETLVCKGTKCGDVECGGEASCSCGENCVAHVTCNWGGWKYADGTYFSQAGAVVS